MFQRIIILMSWLTVAVFAGGPDHELDGPLAMQIINLQAKSTPPEARVSVPDVRIAMIQAGTTKEGPFELAHVRRVTSVEAVLESGAKVRRVACREFHWSEEYGWFTWESRKERTGESIWIWSELKGEVVVR